MRLISAVLLAAGFLQAQDPDPILIKHYSAHGFDLWPLKMLEMANGDLFIAGQGQTFRDTIESPFWNTSEFFLIGTQPDGGQKWMHTFGDTLISDLADMFQIQSGQVLITGSSHSRKLVFLEFSAHGELQRSFFQPDIPELGDYSVKILEDGYIVFLHTRIDTMSEARPTLLRLDEDGLQIWYKNFSSDLFISRLEVEQLENGNFILIGQNAYLDRDYTTAYTLDANGDSVSLFRSNSEFQPADIVRAENGSWAAVGHRGSSDYFYGGVELAVLKMDALGATDFYLGQTLFYRGENMGNVLNNSWYGNTIERSIDGGFLISGRSFVKGSSRGIGSKISADGIYDWSHARITGTAQQNSHALQTRDSAYTFIQSEPDSNWSAGSHQLNFSRITLLKYQCEQQAAPVQKPEPPFPIRFSFSAPRENCPFITFEKPFSGTVTLFTHNGTLVNVYSARAAAGLDWKALSSEGLPVVRGVYILQITSGPRTFTQKFLVP